MIARSKTAGAPSKGLPAPARVYVFGVMAAGLFIVAWRFVTLPVHFGIEELVLFALALALGRHTVRIGKNLDMSGVLPLIFTALLTRGVPTALDVALISMVSLCFLGTQTFTSYRTAFNMASLLCTTLVSGMLYEACGADALHPVAWISLLAVLVALLVYYLVNTLMVAVAVGLSTHSPILPLWAKAYAGACLSYLAGASLAVAVASLIRFAGIGAAVLLFAPVLLILQSYQLGADLREERRNGAETLDRLDQERRRRLELERQLDGLTAAHQTAGGHPVHAL